MALQVCAAHEILYDTVVHLRETTEAGFISLEKKQSDGFDRMIRIINENKKNKWTPRTIVALIAAFIGPTGVAAYAIFFMGAK